MNERKKNKAKVTTTKNITNGIEAKSAKHTVAPHSTTKLALEWLVCAVCVCRCGMVDVRDDVRAKVEEFLCSSIVGGYQEPRAYMR